MATHVDIVAQFDDRSVMVSANDLKRNLERSGDEAGDAWAAGFQRSAPKIQQAYEKAYGGAAKASSTLRAEEAKLNDVRDKAQKSAQELAEKEERLEHFRTNLPGLTATIAEKERELVGVRERHNTVMTQLTVRSEALTRAHIAEQSSMSSLGGAFKAVETGASDAESSLAGLGDQLGKLATIGGPVGITLIVAGLTELVGIASAASGALGVIPGVATAAGAAIGTVALATYGFGDALKAVGDPAKFGEALKQLSPNAQQAALSIQALMPMFTELRKATSDAFFAGVGPQLQQLSSQLLPTIQTLTTGIAGAMNQAFSGVAAQLMTPETQASIKTFVDNITKAFQNLAPAAAPFTKAIADLVAASSGVLPQIASAASEAARAFSQFITEATKSGEFQQWMQTGLNTLKQMGPIAMDIGSAFLRLAPVGERIMPSIVVAVDGISKLLPPIIDLIAEVPSGFDRWIGVIDRIAPAFKPVEAVLSTILDAMALLGTPQERAQAALSSAQLKASMGILPSGFNGGGGGSFGPADSGHIALPGASGQWWHGSGVRGSGGYGWGNPPPAKPGSSSALPQSPATPYNSSLPPGFANLPQTASLYSAETNYMDANTALATKQARLDQLQKVNNATAADIQKARNDVITAEHTQHEAELRLYTARDELYKKSNAQMSGYANQLSEIGVKLDQDLGISKGLAGMADNLVRFLGSLALAPWEAQQNAISNAPGQAQGGFGAIGIAGAQGAFGPQYTAAGQAAASGSGASALGPAALQPGGAYAGDAALLANVPKGVGQYDNVTKDLSKGLVDCASGVEDLVNIMDGRSTAGGSLWTGNAASVLPQMGFVPGMGGPGDFRIGYNSHHMQATLPGGTNVNYGSTPAIQSGGIAPNEGAYDPSFTQHYYRPVGAGGVPSAVSPTDGGYAPATTAPASGGYGGQSFPIPLPVTIVGGALDGGGGFPGLGAPGAGAPGVGAPGAPGAAPSPTPGGSLGDIYSPANTSPGLNNPPAPGGPGWGTPPGQLPGIPAGGGGGSGLMGLGGPMAGAGAGSQIGAAVGPPKGTGSGGVGMTEGGLLDTAIGLGAAAFPGVGQAAQTGIKLANRAIKFAGQAAAIGVQGIQQTFLPTGGSELANNSWFSKILGGIAGAAPALPNMAGKKAAPTGQDQQGGQGQGGTTYGDTNISVKEDPNRGADGTGRDIAWHAQNMYQPAGKP